MKGRAFPVQYASLYLCRALYSSCDSVRRPSGGKSAAMLRQCSRRLAIHSLSALSLEPSITASQRLRHGARGRVFQVIQQCCLPVLLIFMLVLISLIVPAILSGSHYDFFI